LVRVFNLNTNQEKYLNLADSRIQQYWSHTIQNISHQSKGFKKEFSEHFGIFRLYSKLPYNSIDYICKNNEHTL
jgi:hypothetical protein